MSVVKTLLKNARQALNEKDNAYCISQCQSVLEIDPASYNALVFIGLAHANLEEYTQGENSYNNAIKIDGKNLLAWQGLLSLYEKAGKPTQYVDTSSRIAAIHAEKGDEAKCLQVINQALDYARKHGTSSDISQSLRLILPISPFFHLLQDDLPSPADTYVELAALLEKEDATQISVAIAKGRSRLGVNLNQLTKDTKHAVYSASHLESVYGEIINWSLEESVRRQAEEKLLQRIVDDLEASPTREKSSKISRVLSTAHGMTVVKVPAYLAWQVTFNWNDFYMNDASIESLLNFSVVFANDPIAKAIRTYIFSEVSPFPAEVLKRYSPRESGKEDVTLDLSDAGSCTNAFLELREVNGPNFWLFCARVLLHLHFAETEWSLVIDTATMCLDKVKEVEVSTSLQLDKVRAECNYYCAVAMTNFRAPRFHSQAMDLFGEVIKANATQFRVKASIGEAKLLRLKGHVAEAQKKLVAILEQNPEEQSAQLEMAQCALLAGDFADSLRRLTELTVSMAESGDRTTLALIYYTLGDCQNKLQAPNTEVYTAYIQSLKYDSNYAPTYTALGKYYADVVNDSIRAEKCFQKALELSSAEVDSAQRLAAAFANNGDWELVDIIAQRVIQGNETLRVAWPHKALGFVYVNHGKYQLAVSSFQAGLRLSTKDVDAWIGLGEAYLELGRYSAAEKAFERASSLDPNNWYSRYLKATVATALGEHESACSILEGLVDTDYGDGIKITLCLTYLSWSKESLRSGWLSKAISLATKCLQVALQLLSTGETSAYSLLGQTSTVLARCNIRGDAEITSTYEALEKAFSESDFSQETLPVPENPLPLGSSFAYISCKAFLNQMEHQDPKSDEEAVLWSYIGTSLQLILPHTEEGLPYRSAAIEAFKCAVHLQPDNDLFWSALGTAAACKDVSFAQHCFIKAVTLNSKSAVHWTNLGYLYLKLSHLEAANMAFMFAQTSDPGHALAWLGQACIAHNMGESDHELFEHALSLGSASLNPLLAIEYVQSVMRREDGSPSNTVRVQAIWMLEQARKKDNGPATDQLIEYLRILLLEQLDQDRAPLIDAASSLADSLEAAYDTDESETTLARYCDAKALVARLHLATLSHQDALDAAVTVVELEPTSNPESLLSSRIVTGLAQYFLGEQEAAVATLTELLEESQGDTELDVLHHLVRVMASSDDSKSSAAALVEPRNDALSQMLYMALSQKEARNLPALEGLNAAQRAQRDAIERVVGYNSEGVAYSQVNRDPHTTRAWLVLAESAANTKTLTRFMEMALHGANMNEDMNDLALACRMSLDPALRAVSLYIAPQAL